MYDFMLASFAPVFAAGDHMIMAHISETTLYTVIKFHICFSPTILTLVHMKF